MKFLRLIPFLVIGFEILAEPHFGKKVDDYLSIQKNFSGAVLIAKEEQILFKKFYGFANYEFQVTHTNETKFPIASNTKTVTAVAILHLQEKGLLSVSDRVNKYIAGFTDEITIHHLLTHTSGIANYYRYWDSIANAATMHDVIQIVKDWPLVYKPGSGFAYSNTGYFLLAYIIQRVTGKSFSAYLTESIFLPLGMQTSGTISNNNELIPNKASGYQQRNGKVYPAPNLQNPMLLAGNGDLYATIDEMYLWTKNLFSGKIINQDSLACLIAPHVSMGESSDRFHAYGLFRDSIQKKLIVEYTGSLVGYLSKVTQYIHDNITIIILTNQEDGDQFMKISDHLNHLILNHVCD